MIDPELLSLVRAELDGAVPDGVRSLARVVAARHDRAAIAVLFYGSCLRSADVHGQMLDLYLLLDDYARAYPKSWLAIANRLLPPNLFPIGNHGQNGKRSGSE